MGRRARVEPSTLWPQLRIVECHAREWKAAEFIREEGVIGGDLLQFPARKDRLDLAAKGIRKLRAGTDGIGEQEPSVRM